MSRQANEDMFLLARQSRGLKANQLAEDIGVSPTYISKIEKGTLQPSEEKINDIASRLNYPVSLFFRTEHVRGSDSACTYYRKQKTMPAPLIAVIESQMHLAQIQVLGLLTDLDIESPNEFLALDPDEFDNDPRKMAMAVRRTWRIPNGPIRDLTSVIESAGAVVIFRDFGTLKLDGMSCRYKGMPPLFFVNASIPMDRARFTLAHELGHLVMHSRFPAGDPEQEAHEFASEFLMPAAEIKHDLVNLDMRKLASLKIHWGTSMQSIVMAAKSLGLLDQMSVKKFFQQFSRRGWRSNEPYEPTKELPGLLPLAIKTRQTEWKSTVEDLAELSDLEVDEFRTLYMPEEKSPRLRLVR